MRERKIILLCSALCLLTVRCTAENTLLQRALSSAKAAPAHLSLCHEDSSRYESFVRQQTQKQQERDEGSTRQLFEWCREDAQCCAAYYMKDCTASSAHESTYSDYETFRYLISHWHAPNDPLTSLLDAGGYCGHQRERTGLKDKRRVGSHRALEPQGVRNDTDDPLRSVLRYAWTVEMRLQTYEKSPVRCGENEHFTYSPSDAEGRCICNSDSSDECHAIRRHRVHDPVNYSFWSILVVCIMAALYFVLEIVLLYRTFVIYDKIDRRLQSTASDDDNAAAAPGQNPRDSFMRTLHKKQQKAANL